MRKIREDEERGMSRENGECGTLLSGKGNEIYVVKKESGEKREMQSLHSPYKE